MVLTSYEESPVIDFHHYHHNIAVLFFWGILLAKLRDLKKSFALVIGLLSFGKHCVPVIEVEKNSCIIVIKVIFLLKTTGS
jgi:hypothetical protein